MVEGKTPVVVGEIIGASGKRLWKGRRMVGKGRLSVVENRERLWGLGSFPWLRGRKNRGVWRTKLLLAEGETPGDKC